nr:hypothetical protein CFP56_00146 [Quercus suber]
MNDSSPEQPAKTSYSGRRNSRDRPAAVSENNVLGVAPSGRMGVCPCSSRQLELPPTRANRRTGSAYPPDRMRSNRSPTAPSRPTPAGRDCNTRSARSVRLDNLHGHCGLPVAVCCHYCPPARLAAFYSSLLCIHDTYHNRYDDNTYVSGTGHYRPIIRTSKQMQDLPIAMLTWPTAPAHPPSFHTLFRRTLGCCQGATFPTVQSVGWF